MAQTVFKRSEVKFLLDRDQRARLERVMAAHMAEDAYGASTICSLYYDTPTLLLARRSAEHPAYKEKVRERSYGVFDGTRPVFAEIKKKYDGVVYKRRAELSEERARELLAGQGRPHTQIEREIDFTVRRYEDLGPRVIISYDRRGFFSPDDHEFRMTLDARPRARWERLWLGAGDDGEALLDDGLSILEVKCLEGMPLWLVRHLSAEGIRKTSCSKLDLACRRRAGVRTVPATRTQGAPAIRAGVPATGPAEMPAPWRGRPATWGAHAPAAQPAHMRR